MGRGTGGQNADQSDSETLGSAIFCGAAHAFAVQSDSKNECGSFCSTVGFDNKNWAVPIGTAQFFYPRRGKGLLHAVLVGLDHLLDHLAADAAGFLGGQIAVVALLQVDAHLP